MALKRRLIEDTFPVKEVSKESAREKNIRHGHISTLHIWWARRPLASSRATNYSALVLTSESQFDRENRRKFVSALSRWENSLNYEMIARARADILASNGGKRPRVLDPFAGGGSIALEALRLGCETYASDYNPVATLILKCTLAYPQKYGHDNQQGTGFRSRGSSGTNRLLEDVKKWSNLVFEEAKKEIARFYPQDKDGSIPVGYVWARTIPCQNPTCGAEIPLMRQFWLAKKKDKEVSLYPYVSNGKVNIKIVGTGYEKMPSGFNPGLGTVSRAIAKCLVCGSVIDGKTTARLFREGGAGQRMVAVVLHKPKASGKKYRLATEQDIEIFKEAVRYLEEKRKKLLDEWGMDPVPDEPLPPVGTLGFGIQRYGMNTWGDLFNSRQKLALITFVEKVREAHKRMIEEGYDQGFTKIVVSYLAVMLDRLADKNSNLVFYNVVGEKIEHVFGRQALGMVWDYAEVNPFTDVGWPNMQDWIERVIIHCSASSSTLATISQSSACSIPYPDQYFDGVITDPPYYDNVPYSYLSDFFYVWLKRAIGDLYPDLFTTPLTPKSEEIVAYSNKEGGFEQGKRYFEEMLKKSFTEIHRVLKPDGVSVIVYAHKSVAGWETLVNSLLDSGLVVSGAWPIHTERKSRLRAKESAALASSIYMVSRKARKLPTAFYKEVKAELQDYLSKKLDFLWNEGISGADLFISAIGSAIQVFGIYEQVINDEGQVIRVDRLLEDVRKVVADYAVGQVLHNGFAGEISQMTRLYVLWRWAYQDRKLEFDDARKLASGIGIDLALEWNKGFIRKDKEYIEILGPEDRNVKDLEGSKEMIDVLHHVLLLWKQGRNEQLMSVLKESGFGGNDIFYRVAQAISESLSNESKEKKLLDGFLSGRQRISENLRKDSDQRKLFDEESDDYDHESKDENMTVSLLQEYREPL